MTIRPLLLGLPLLLAGCSSSSSFSWPSFSWSSLSPFNWFGSSSMVVSEKGVGDITATTPMTASAISKGLQDNYPILSGMTSYQGQVVSYFQAMAGNDVKLVITGEFKGSVQRIEVMDSKVPTEWGSKLGTPFSELFSKAYGACKAGEGDNAGKVECVATQSRHVSYVFNGQWAGPQEIIPPDNILQSWTVSKIIWHAKAQ
ncbi:RpoE-regulated lipoprotein [Serratia sp. DD3]|uniref:RpoE-regulated lipoprotein n=1 Tax=Serratia sp. DD3 TaxID=1410619 RepID=UPI0003C514F3|nr:RpoE-regulated lipoprotein [Serratia sp. DD3]